MLTKPVQAAASASVQTAATASSVTAQPSAWNIAQRLVRKQGIAGLYHGVLPSVLRAFCVSATRFSAYEAVIRYLRKDAAGDISSF